MRCRQLTLSFVALLLSVIWGPGSFIFQAANADNDIDKPVGDKWALVVGISQFKNPGINGLKYAAKDATDFADYLVREAGFAADHVKVITNEQATQKRIMSELGSKWLPKVATPDDLVVIFISSHGSPAEMDLQGVNYIIAHDSDPEDLYTTAIEMQDLVGTISRRLHSKRLVVFLDSCHSGATNTGAKGLKRTNNIDLDKVPLGVGQLVISSSQSDQVSWELKNHPNGAFTYCLLDVLRKQKDTAFPPAFTSLQDSVQQTVLRERGALQTPALKSTWKGIPVSLNVKPANPHEGLDEAAEPISSPSNPSASSTTAVNPPPVSAPGSATPPPVMPAPPPQKQPAAVSKPAVRPPVEATVQKTALPDSIAILPFVSPRKYDIQKIPPNFKVLWGCLRSPEELAGLPRKLGEHVFHSLRAKFGSRVLGPRSVEDSLTDNSITAAGNGSWSQADWQRAGVALQSRFLITATIDEVGWSTSVMANKYTMVVSAKLISGESGEVLAEAKGLKVHKAPFQGDAGGAAKYFETTVADDAADEIAKKFSSSLRK